MSDTSGSTPPPRTTGGNWRWEPPTPDELQRILPQYAIDKLIGRGGMGAVYRGVQLSLERPVAIKVLPPAVEQQDAAFAERFRNEAKVMGRMNHPAIVSVYDFGRTEEGQLYFVMEYVDGTDVQQMIATHGKLPPEHALAVTAHLCDALGYAHKQGVVHRDIKPSNVLIDSDGRVKVADFGLAKLTGNVAQTRGLTQTGLAMGTPDYVAPESLTLGMEVDGRADLYAVGVMLYQMLTGDIPRGMFKMPSQKFSSIDPRFDRIVRRALEHDREERYQSSGEIRHDLDIILTTPLAETGKQSSAALPKQLAAQVPGRTVVPKQGPRRANPPPEPFYEELKSSPTWPYVLGIVLILAAAGWAVFHRPARTGPGVEPEPKKETPTPVVVVPVTPPTPPKTEPVKPIVTPVPTPPTPPTVKPMAVVVTPTPPPTVPPGVPPSPLPMATNTAAIKGAGMPTASRLLMLEDIFQDEFDSKVNAAYNDNLKELGTKYLAKLAADLAVALQNRQSADAKALEDEKVRFRTHQFMPSIDPPGLPRVVTNLRDIYRATEKAYVQQKDANSLPYYDQFINALNLLEKEAIAQGRTSDAAKIRSKREDVISRRKQRAAKVPANLLPRATGASNGSRMDLFDGQTLNGWRVVGDADSFKVVNGEITATGRRGNLIFVGAGGTSPVWKDFILDLKIRCADAANSGIWLHIPDPTTIINRKVSAFEVNIDERGKGTTGEILAAVEIQTGAPMNSRLETGRGKGPYLGSIKNPPSGGRFDQWQALRIMAKAGVFTVWIDGQQVNQWSFPSGWTPPTDKSYVQTFEGTIGLQSVLGSVAFKDIAIEVL